MSDIMSPEKRHQVMQRIKCKETEPEIQVRKWLFSHGIRYRKNVRELPGTPDIVIPNKKVVVFINGCFWHGHVGCKDFVIPKTRTQWWIDKISATQKRDADKSSMLEKMGWHVITIWECQVKRDFEDSMQLLLSDIEGQYSRNKETNT